MIDFAKELGAIDWKDSLNAYTICDDVIGRAISGGHAKKLLASIPHNAELLKLCEQLQGLKKLVLFDQGDNGVRIRLHLFEQYSFEVAHNHRWSFYSRILRGNYLQSIHGTISEKMTAADIASAEITTILNLGTRQSYFLHHTSIHSLRAERSTVSIIVRGPIARKNALWCDLKQKTNWEHLGDKTDTLKRPLTLQEVETTIHAITDWGIL